MSGGDLSSPEWYYSDDCPVGLGNSKQPGKTWIYGIYNMQGCCLYVGQTIDFRQRWETHKGLTNPKFAGHRPIAILPLELVPSESAMKRERHFQFAFEKIGQAQLSKPFWRTKSGKLKKSTSILWRS